MSRYMDIYGGVSRCREEWELTQPDKNVKIEPNILQVLQRKYILLDMEMIQSSKNHACVRKLYALSKDGKTDIEIEFEPCKKFIELEDKYKKSFLYCKKNIHKLSYYPSKKCLPCIEAKDILKNFVLSLDADIIFYKGGIFERDISTEIGIGSFDIAQLGVKKVNSHDPKKEIQLHYKQIIRMHCFS